ncbi:hypothetical protein [Actinomadura livida]|uniref:Uncharacterized protein n=1 Tax=Actinomadura livida TaxID=79909 RepID=A0A7W7IK77_9ACTN|nr:MULTISPECIES: hypothetical protein [Actinomadura]MBB4778570.1 hypothetical protein [Actinomadura catellatispora]GGU29920.1 hypothetical protein GCM10010208_63330 [Actinomadura livida]
MSGTVPEVWIEAGGGQDMVRADMIVVLRLDETGRLTAQLRDEARVSVTLLEGSADPRPPDDFHRRLIRTVAELGRTGGAQLVRARHDGDGWHWVSEPV